MFKLDQQDSFSILSRVMIEEWLPFQNQFLIELEISKITYRNKFHQLAICDI